MKKFLPALILISVPALAQADGYPTLERVDHVLTCMRTNGGQNVDNLYACSCEIDIIAQRVDFDEFSEARTFEIYKRMPGEKGGLFRDSARAKEVVGKLEQARADARKRCFIGKKAPHHEPPKPVPDDSAAAAAPATATAPPAAP